MEKKQIIQILLTVFVAVIFVASYASFGNNGTANVATSITTTVQPATAYASGNANAMVSGYGPSVSLNINCNNASLMNSTVYNVSLILNNLENNNSQINTFFPLNETSFRIFTNVNKMNPYQLSTYLNSSLASNQSSCVSLLGQVQVLLPANINFTVASQHVLIPIPSNMRSYPINNTALLPTNSLVPLRVSTLLTQNGTIFGGMIISVIGGK